MTRVIQTLLLIATGLWSAGHTAASEPRVVVWDTGNRVGGEADLGRRETCQLVPPETSPSHAFRGDMLIENDKLQVLFRVGRGGPVVYSRSDVGQGRQRMVLVPLTAKHELCETIVSLKISENTGEEVAIQVSGQTPRGDRARITVALGLARSFVKVSPMENAFALCVLARTRFAVVPDFFGDDMLFDPRKSPGERLFLPAENFLMNFAGEGNTILMGIWPAGDQEVQAILSGEKEQRCFEGLEISLDGKSLYLVVLDGSGIWRSMVLEDAACADKDIATGWKKPFDARWRGDFRLADRTDSWEFESQRRDRVGIDPYGQVVWPFWFENDAAMIRLLRKDYLGSALIYPLERKQSTPLTVFTPVDMLRETLGTGPCEYILDREGIGTRNPGGDRQLVSTGVCNTTGVMQHFFELGLECRERKLVEDLAEDVSAFNITVRQRLEEYRAFARQLVQACQEEKKRNPAIQPVADRVERLQKRLEELFAQRLPAMKPPERNLELVQEIKQLTHEDNPENLGRYLTSAAQLRSLAGTQDSLASAFRAEVRRFRRELGVIAPNDRDSARFLEKLRELSRNVLRKKHYTEGA